MVERMIGGSEDSRTVAACHENSYITAFRRQGLSV